MHFNASHSLTQSLLDCILHLTLIQYPYDPGTLRSASRCLLGKVYLIQPIEEMGRMDSHPREANPVALT